MIESVMTYSESRQAAFRRQVLQARLSRTDSPAEVRRLREALETRVPLVEVLQPRLAQAW